MTPRIRTAGPADLDQIATLLVERGEPADALDHRLVVERAGWDCCAVAVDGDRVVSTATLLDETLVLGGVEIPAGQVELVATDKDYEGQGLVRALMDWAHARSAARGHLVNVMIGIPYFYRRFGYSYVIPIETFRPLMNKPSAVEDYTLRAATAADIPAMAALQDGAQAAADLRMPHSPDCWHWLVDREGSTSWVVEKSGTVVATGRTTPPEEGLRLLEIAAVDDEAAVALLSEFPDATVSARGLPALEPYLGPATDLQAQQYYVRVPDPVALLEHLRPLLSARLSAFGDGEALVSFFRSHVRFSYSAGVVGPMRTGGVMQGPYAQGGAGVAPDLVGSLLFGPLGIDGLRRIHPDVYPGPNEALMGALFPPISADMLTYYVP
ncbi:hypothetical protein [Alloactinosynnema sp. L-07]|uniref:GNAT family N-acetyltransferase n=1 Tax=Alloactinosynnema sp. L-07 TaxID=1653480 RepID=UPI00065EF039|nr:GNAT family N-acetyltransferase [Alloactinosynnema sp. L-07]CRK59868.1 hypothetical protein [Alloactinosynnema sp. L-07]